MWIALVVFEGAQRTCRQEQCFERFGEQFLKKVCSKFSFCSKFAPWAPRLQHLWSSSCHFDTSWATLGALAERYGHFWLTIWSHKACFLRTNFEKGNFLQLTGPLKGRWHGGATKFFMIKTFRSKHFIPGPNVH